MGKILVIGETILNVLNCRAEERINGKRELVVRLLQTEIEAKELQALFKNNTGDITYMVDDVVKEIYSGYKTPATITLDTTAAGEEIYKVVAPCVGEVERKVLEMQAIVNTQNIKIQAQAATIENQTKEIELLNATLLEQILG